MKISAVIIAFNEEAKIRAAIESVKWCDEMLLVDSGSTDSTREIAESYGARVIGHEWAGFSKQKQFAVDQASNDWIFSLDADEVVSEKLRDEILLLKHSDEKLLADGYRIPRLSIYMGREVHHSGWYPDWQLRLFKRTRGRWKDVVIHESVEMDSNARVAKLNYDILHYSVDNAAQHKEMIETRYAPLAAQQMFDAGRKTSALQIAFRPILKFVQTYFLKLGILDGLPGLYISYFAAYHSLQKHKSLRKLQNSIERAE